MDKYKTTIMSPEYDFLRANADLENIAYLVASGSHGYGTNIGTSDLDLRGFLLEDEHYLLGLQTFEQFEEKETDTVIFGAKKFIKLCAQSNPNVLELLGVEEEDILICSDAGRMVRDNVDLFLSKRVEQTFGNYAKAQLKRLQNALVRNDDSKGEKEALVLERLNTQIGRFDGKYSDLDSNALNLRLENNEIVMDLNLQGYPLRDFNGIYTDLQGIVRTFDKARSDDSQKELPRLYKHAMHLVRMLVTGRDILEGKGVITKRRAEHDLLMAIRSGEMTFDEIFERVAVLQLEFDRAAKETALPEQVDMKQIEELLISLYK
ncbi:DNA polymerase beta superfamily protein [Listeria booriae]|uniref:DNA polymerase beta superfamily protein n=1 Tax=Listeria booriae TaxID=1552123 RepID=UPI001624BCAF|nr:nucleotidyltransferase domain-containing protein [Listeria booriae]MBC1973981.1 nucleotidyltransferase [Listeria booriae]MBC1984007.1 nucleotidyltransferase [Listeria booriae]MBC2031689.1 nucleotidyltransferase [Listeria booriae]MBC2263575.1 nucleotidyltransferase [Listeria booriae]